MTAPRFVPVIAVLRSDHAERLSEWCAGQELTAELRASIAILGTNFGWTEEMIKLGTILASAIDTIAPEGTQ